MKKVFRNVVGNLGKTIVAVLALTLVYAQDVSATEEEKAENEIAEAIDSEEIVALSEGIDTLEEQVEDLKKNYSEDEQSVTTEDIKAVSEEIAALDEQIENVSSNVPEEYKTEDDSSDEDLLDEISDVSNGIDTIAEQIEALSKEVANLSKKNAKLVSTILKYQSDIIKGLNNTVCANDKIPSDASFPEIISKINNISMPKIGSSNNNTVNISDKGEISIGVGEKITLPAGYYPESITISNDIVNRGELNWNPAGAAAYNIPSGYYTGGTLNSTNAYNKGYDNGYSAGHGVGYNAGHGAGYNAGHNDGYNAGYNAGYNVNNRSHSVYIHTSYCGNNSVWMDMRIDGVDIGGRVQEDGHFDCTLDINPNSIGIKGLKREELRRSW